MNKLKMLQDILLYILFFPVTLVVIVVVLLTVLPLALVLDILTPLVDGIMKHLLNYNRFVREVRDRAFNHFKK